MNFQTSSGFDHFSLDPPLASLSSHPSQNLPQNPLNSDRIPPPASVATINGDAIDLNDEIFFHTAQNSASPVALNSNYLLDSYHIDPASFGPDISPSAPSGPLVSPSVSHAYLGSSPGHLQVKVHASKILKNPLEALDVKNALDLASFVPESGAPRGLDSDMSQGVKSALSTPVLAFAEPMSYNVHYSHQNRFSTAVEQMNRMSLHTRSSSIDLIPEEKTINPRQLLDCSATSSLASLQNYSLGGPSEKEGDSCVQAATSPSDTDTLKFSAPGKSGQPYSSPSSKAAPVPNRYLSTSVSSPSLSTFFSSHVPDHLDGQGSHSAISALNNPLNPYVMNDECVSAITYWLNNTADVIQEKEKDSAQSAGGHGALKHPVRGSGISKAHWNRRNSIQVVSGSADGPHSTKTSVQKRKRRKSDHLSVKEEKSTFSDFKFMPRASDSAPDPGFAVISESDPSEPSAMSSFSDFPEQKLHKKDEALDAGDPRGAEISRTSSDLAHGPSAEGEDDEPKPFPCPDCEKQFKRSEHLKRHIRSVHSNIRPFHCKYCEKKFSRSDNLAQHSKTHFKINANGTTSVIYGNPNPHNRGGRKQSMSEMELH